MTKKRRVLPGWAAALIVVALGVMPQVTSAQAPTERRARGTSLHLRSGIFDPLTETLPEFAAGRAVSGGEGTFLVQFHRDLTDADRSRLESAGMVFIDYVPDHAYLVRAAPATFQALKDDPLVRWLDAFRGGYKVAPILKSGVMTEPVDLDVRLLPGENPLSLLERLRETDPAVARPRVYGSVATGAILRVRVPAGHVRPFAESAAEDRSVWTVEPWSLPEIQNDDAIWVEQSFDTVNTRNYAISATLWSHGITGTGQTPGVADTGLDDDMCFFRYSGAASEVVTAQSPALPGTGTIDPAKKVAAYYVLPSATAYDGNTLCGGKPESFHGTHTTGTIAGDNFATLSTPSAGGHDGGDGMAPNAKIIFQDAGSETTGCLDGLDNDFHLIWQQAYDAGVRVHSDSWASDGGGAYSTDSRLLDEIVYGHEDLLVVFSAGNGGPSPGTVGSPATAKNVVAVGATGHGGSTSIASFSSRGPALDGRRKPDIVAPGVSTVSASGDTSHVSNNCGTKVLSGTSMAAPTVAGGATLLRQYFTDGFYPTGVASASDATNPSAALLKAALVNGAIDISAATQAAMFNTLTPDDNQGFGRIQLDNVAFFSTPARDARRTRIWDKWNATGLMTGSVDSYPLQITAGQPLKVALAWTDPESSGLAATTLINDLDLEVIDPSGSLYRGNVFSGGQSATGGTADVLNTVEVVFLTAPAAGTWTLRVRGTSVPGSPAHPYSTRQGYALVATYADCLTAPSVPAGFAATDQGAAGIALSWNAAAGAARYQIYRAEGGCGAPATAFHYLGQTTSTSLSDTLIQGGLTYAYKVRAATNCTEGGATVCVSATSTGNCTLYPSFEGVSSVINDLSTSACDSLLGWSAGSSNCPSAPGVSYDVYRSNTPYFSPGPGTLLEAGVPLTDYRDQTVTANTAYYYTVLAEDGTTTSGGPANGGNLDTNRLVLGVTPTSASSHPGTWTDDGDLTARLVLDAPWRVSNQQNHTTGATLSYHTGADGIHYPPYTCAAATTPPIPLLVGQAPVLSYWVRYELEPQWDGVVVEISTNNGASFTPLTPASGYPNTLAMTGSPPINACAYPSTQGAFTGMSSVWTQYTHDLTAYAGQTVLIRWRFSTDPASEFEGFYLDDVTVTQAMTPSSCGADLRVAAGPAVQDTCIGGGGGGNGRLEAGEDATLPLSLQNVGDTTATGVSGILSTAQGGVVITRPGASFANAPGGAIVTSVAPHFGVWVAPTVACGTVVPFTLALSTGQGTFTQNFSLTIGNPGTPCTQTICTSAIPAEDGTIASPLLVAPGAGGSLLLSFGLSCHAVDSTIYSGLRSSPIGGVQWTSAVCGFGARGSATFNPGNPPAGSLYYFIVVPSNGVVQGSYGHDSSGAEIPPASGLGSCNLPRSLGGICP